MTIPDPLAAVINYLQADHDVEALVSDRVFGVELPAEENESMPRKCVVLTPSGGMPRVGGSSFLSVTGLRVDVKSYAETPYEAAEVHWAVHHALKNLDRQVQLSSLLHNAIQESGPFTMRDSDTEWPMVLSVWNIMAAEVSVP